MTFWENGESSNARQHHANVVDEALGRPAGTRSAAHLTLLMFVRELVPRNVVADDDSFLLFPADTLTSRLIRDAGESAFFEQKSTRRSGSMCCCKSREIELRLEAHATVRTARTSLAALLQQICDAM